VGTDAHGEAVVTASAKRLRRNVDGIVLLDKPLGMTSNRAVQRVKQLFAAAKAGHTGSLDPLATGMLPICLGQATKMSAFLLDSDKAYRVRVCFGTQTATGDAEGRVLRHGPDSVPDADLQRALESFHGSFPQTPPMYSALKHNGQRLYELARAGREVPRAPRMVHVHELLVETPDLRHPVLGVRCGKGTYIRCLVEDIAHAAGTVAHVAELRRLAVEPFSEAAMCTLQELEAAAGEGNEAIERFLITPEAAVSRLPGVHLSRPDALRIRHGQQVSCDAGRSAGMVRLYDDNGRFMGVGERLPDGNVRPRRLMSSTA
jgi:tRNA pseudouridine55 synthase